MKKYHIKGVISDKQFLEIKDVVFTKILEAVFGNTHFKGGKRWKLGAWQKLRKIFNRIHLPQSDI